MSGTDALMHEDRLRFGVRVSGLSRAAAFEEIRKTEACGYDSLWVTDHLAFHAPLTDSMALLAFAAALTERVTLGTSIYLLPLRSSVATAKQTASIDMLSNGRLILGVGVGGEYPPEFEAAGIAIDSRGARTDEMIPLLRRLWTEDRVEHIGRHERFPALTVAPHPTRAGGPPIWVGGRSPAAMRRAGRFGDGYISHMTTPEQYAENLSLIARAAQQAGGAPRPFSTAGFFFTCIGDTVDSAAETITAELERLYAQPFARIVKRYCLLGPPESIRARLQQYIDAGLRHIVIAPLLDEATVIERMADEVRPELALPAP